MSRPQIITSTEAHSLVDALLKVQRVQADYARAENMCAADDLQAVFFQRQDELVALWRVAADLGLNMRTIEAALGSGGGR